MLTRQSYLQAWIEETGVLPSDVDVVEELFDGPRNQVLVSLREKRPTRSPTRVRELERQLRGDAETLARIHGDRAVLEITSRRAIELCDALSNSLDWLDLISRTLNGVEHHFDILRKARLYAAQATSSVGKRAPALNVVAGSKFGAIALKLVDALRKASNE